MVFTHRMWLEEIPIDAENSARAMELARVALRLAPRDEWSHWVMSDAYCTADRLEDAVAESELALEINPNCTVILDGLAYCLACLGRPQESLQASRLALRLNPRDPSNFWRHHTMANAHFIAADYTDSLEESKRVARSRQLLASGVLWAASAAALDKTDEAQAAVKYCLSLRPGLCVRTISQRSDPPVGTVMPEFVTQFARVEDHERLLALLRKAGLPE
jgi:tetratricopeptide (TPR) repeat protein